MNQQDPQRHMQNGHPVRVVRVIRGSELEEVLDRMKRPKKLHDLKASGFQDHQKVPEYETPEEQLAHVRRLMTERIERIYTGTNHT